MAYDKWADLVAAEDPGNYTMETVDQRSQWALVAIHGGWMEVHTDRIVRDIAARVRYSHATFRAHDATQPPNNQRMRISSVNWDEPTSLKMLRNATYTLSFHAGTEPDTPAVAWLDGLDTGRKDRLIQVVDGAGVGIDARTGGNDGGGGQPGQNDFRDPGNVANQFNRTKKGICIELNRASRALLFENPTDPRSAPKPAYEKFIKAIADYLDTYDKYNRWSDLAAIEKSGTDYTIEDASPGAPWAHIAVHGGKIELMTSSLAKAVAQKATHKYWVFNGIKAANNADLHITSTRFDNPDALTMLASVNDCISYHGMADASRAPGDPVDVVYVGGLDTANRDKIIKALVDKGFKAKASGKETSHLDGDDPDNICNRTRKRKGVQLELSRTLRNSFLQSGNAADEGNSPVTQKFTDFVDAIYSVVKTSVTPAAERPFDVGEFGARLFDKDVALAGKRVIQQAIHEEITNDVFTTQVIDGGLKLQGETAPVSGAQRAANGDLVITRVNDKGEIVSKMYALKFDHGSSLSGVENIDGTNVYLWLGADAKVAPIGGNGHATKVGRLHYQTDSVVRKGDSQLTLYDPLGGEEVEYIAPCVDFVHNRMVVYYQKDSKHYYRFYDLDEFKRKRYTQILPEIGPIVSPRGSIRQNFTAFGDYIYQFHGTGYDDKNPPYPKGIGNVHLLIIDIHSGKIIEDHIRNTELNYVYREPEAINIWSPVSRPRLMYGWAVGETGQRKMHLRAIDARWPYRNWADLTANAKEGTDYKVHYSPGAPTAAAPNDVSQIAIHGEKQEGFTMKLAKAVADANKNQFFAVEGLKSTTAPDNNNLLRIPAPLFDHPQALQMQQSVEYSFSYHGRADDTDDPQGGIARIGGLDRVNGARLINQLAGCGINAEYGGREGGGWGDHTSPANIVNRNVSGAGVQIELSRTLRDRMSTTGNAGDPDAQLNDLGKCFVRSVAAIARDPRNNTEQETGEQKCIRYFLNGYELNQPQRGIRLMGGTEWASAISPRRFELELPKWHGQMAMWHDPLDTMKVTFEVEISAPTESVLRQRWNEFVSLAGSGKWVPVRLHRARGIFLKSDPEHAFEDTNAPYWEYASAQLESLSAPEYTHAAHRLTTTAVFNVPAGQWRSNKIYTQTWTRSGDKQKCVVAKVSSVPVYSMIIRVQGGPGGNNTRMMWWNLIDYYSNTGVGWDDPSGIDLNDGEWLYCNTDNMRAYISNKRDMIKPGESWAAFITRIGGKAAWSNFRYIRNGPLMLTHKLEWKSVDGGEPMLQYQSGLNVVMRNKDNKSVNREVVIRAHAANR